jgi:cation:H+ antiporter
VKAIVLGLLTGHGPAIPLLALAAVAVLVFLVTARLARHADTIADRTGLGRVWIGTVLLAATTSLPELLTNVNAGLLDEPDIGAGDLLGASLANMLILAMLDLVFARRRILHQVAIDHTLVGLLGILLAAMVGTALVTGGWGRIGHVGLESPAILLVYLGGMAAVYRSAVIGPVPLDDVPPGEKDQAPLRAAVAGFALGAAGLVLLAPLLVLAADAVSQEAGLTATFVGTLLVGLTTSLPELAATVSAVRIGALDLAAGNVFGSVAFNLLVFVFLDVAYRGGPLVQAISRDHLLTIFALTVCLSLALMAMLSRARRRPGPVLVESVLVVVAYALAAWLLARGGV